MHKTTRATRKNFIDRSPSLTQGLMNVRRTLLFAGAIAAAVSTQPEPAYANDAAIGLGLGLGALVLGGIINASRQPQAQPYAPQPAYTGNSAACQSWLAVLNNPSYDATTRAQAQQIVSSCGLPYSLGGGPASTYAQTPAPTYAPATAPVSHPHEIALRSDGQHYHVNGTVNGIPTDFILDTGASGISLSYAAANQLGLGRQDVVDAVSVTGVNGRSIEPVVLLHEVNIGGYVLHNAKAGVGNFSLLGQGFLAKLGAYTIDNQRGVLVLNG